MKFNFQALVSSFIKEIIEPSDLRLVPLKVFWVSSPNRVLGLWVPGTSSREMPFGPSLKLVNFNFKNEEVLSVKFF